MQTAFFRLLAVAGIAGVASGAFATILQANPGPANNGGSPNWAIFFDLTAGANSLNITGMQSANTGAASASFNVELFTRVGTGLGGPVASGPGSSPAGWTSLGIVSGTQGGTANGISLMIDTPDFVVSAGSTVGVALRFTVVGPRYTNGTVYTNYSDSNLTIRTGDGRSAPFTPTGSWFSPRLLTGAIEYNVVPEPATITAMVGGLGLLLRRRSRKA
jgi:hypothetical protein